MKETKEQVEEFLDKCEEIKKCKFIMATTKIKDLLKCIVNNPELYALFDSISKDFDYTLAKRDCLVSVNNGFIVKNEVILPDEVGKRLAFIFCLLCEFDNGSLNFNDFLRTYFAEDGSYFASYQAFCESVITNLEDMIKQVFEVKIEAQSSVNDQETKQQTQEAAEVVLTLITEESERLFKSGVSVKEKEAGFRILDELRGAVKECNENLIDALICGYNYFVMFNGIVDKSMEELIVKIFEFESKL